MNIFSAIREEMLVPIHPAGWPFIGLFVALTLVIGLVFEPFFWIGIPASLWCVYFFRNPTRITPTDPMAVIAPADGRVLSTQIADVPPELDLPAGQWRCISIFMNVFDVHVNRSPVTGMIADSHYIKGAFVNASLDKANIDNERQSLVIKTEHASMPFIGCVQIAGLVARRILCDVNKGDRVFAGHIYGLIRFGSRVDVWVPANCIPLVLAGQRTIAGETVLTKVPAEANVPQAEPRQAKKTAAQPKSPAKASQQKKVKKATGKPAKKSITEK
jgi:phosphatidylserine decarboxylase